MMGMIFLSASVLTKYILRIFRLLVSILFQEVVLQTHFPQLPSRFFKETMFEFVSASLLSLTLVLVEKVWFLGYFFEMEILTDLHFIRSLKPKIPYFAFGLCVC